MSRWPTGRPIGRPRKLTAEQLRIVRRWKSLSQLAREWGVNPETVHHARNYAYKPRRA